MNLANIDVELIDEHGSDLTVVNAARVSFGKEHTELTEADVKLIKYLADNDHWSPFAHCYASFRVKAPIYVARQLAKHQVGFSWNEESRRYISHEPEFYIPGWLRQSSPDIKQGSLEVPVENNESALAQLSAATEDALETYQDLLLHGVCPEQARMVLPLNTMTNWIWSGSLYAWAHMVNLRLTEDTQSETCDVAEQVDGWMLQTFPISWPCLIEDNGLFEVAEGTVL